MKERLIELLKKSHCVETWNYNTDDFKEPNPIETLADFLLENGAIVPPCKVGQTVYRIVKMSTGVTSKSKVFVMEGKLHGTITPCKPTIKWFIRCVTVTKNNIIDCCENFGKTVFLTKEEAEKALKGVAE